MNQDDEKEEPVNPRDKAAYLLAVDDLTDEEISKDVGISRSTLIRWKNQPDFQQAIDGHRQEIRKRIRSRGIAIIENRIQGQHDRWLRMRRIIDERAAAPGMLDIPGGTTGLLVKRLRQVGTGKNAEVVEEYELDAALLRELREIENLVANELGQREIRMHAHNTHDDPARDDLLRKMTDDPDFALAASDLVFRLAGHAGGNGLPSHPGNAIAMASSAAPADPESLPADDGNGPNP